jgi:hypothetical protein
MKSSEIFLERNRIFPRLSEIRAARAPIFLTLNIKTNIYTKVMSRFTDLIQGKKEEEIKIKTPKVIPKPTPAPTPTPKPTPKPTPAPTPTPKPTPKPTPAPTPTPKPTPKPTPTPKPVSPLVEKAKQQQQQFNDSKDGGSF